MANNTGRKTVTIGTTDVTVSNALPNTSRVLFILQNTSTGGQKITIGIGQEAVAGNGIVLSPGGYYSETRDENFNPSNEDLHAIADGANATLGIVERTERKAV